MNPRRQRLWATGIGAFALAVTTTSSAPALPKFQRPGIPIDPATGVIIDCPDVLEPTVELVRYTSLIGYPITGFTVKVSAETVKFHGKPLAACGFPDYVAPLPAWAWSLASRPAGSAAQLFDTATLTPRLPLDRAGTYVVRLTVCPEGCTIQPPGSHSSPIDVEPQIVDVPVEVRDSAPLGPETVPAVVPSPSAGLTTPPGQCGLGAGAIAKQWWAVRQIDGPETYRLLEGVVRHSRVSRKDSPLNHDSQDTNYHVEPDPKYSDLRFEDPNSPLPEPIEVEWERDSIPERYRPTPGDRVSLFGYWVTDCGHGRPEIHPPVGVAVHRPRPIRIPDGRTFPELGGQTAGTGIYVPGVITDVFFGRDGGDLVDCSTGTGLANAERVPGPNGTLVPGCVPAPSLDGLFEFDIYLPRNPQVTMRQAGFDVPPLPLFVQSDPVTGPAPVIEASTDSSGILTYLHVTLDLRGYTGSTYAHRIAAGWVLPAADNWGLARHKLRLVRLNVTDDGDGTARGDGDWRLWVNTNNASNESFAPQEWVQIIDYDVHGVEDFGGRPWQTGLPGEPGAPAADRSLGPDLLRYPAAAADPFPGPRDYGILFHSTGYEADTLTDDDAGTVLHSRLVPGATYALPNQCTPSEQAGGVLYSGCVRYTAVVEAVPGPALARAALSPAMQALVDQYVLRCQRGGLCGRAGLDDIVGAPLLASPVDPLDVPLPLRAAAVEFTDFAAFEPAERETTSLTDIAIADFYRDVLEARKRDPAALDRVMKELRAVLVARITDRATAREALLDAPILRASLPRDVWAKYFSDVPRPRPQPGASRAVFVGAGRLEAGREPIRLKTVRLHCDPLRGPNRLSIVGGSNRFDLDLVLDSVCSDQEGTRGSAHVQHGVGIGRLNGTPGAIVEWTLVDGGHRSGHDTATIAIRTDDGGTSVLEESGRIKPGGIVASGHDRQHGCAGEHRRTAVPTRVGATPHRPLHRSGG